jgi:hypothetical protein
MAWYLVKHRDSFTSTFTDSDYVKFYRRNLKVSHYRHVFNFNV